MKNYIFHIYFKIFITLVHIVQNPLKYLIMNIILVFIIRVILLDVAYCAEPEITIEYVKLREPYTPPDLYSRIDTMYGKTGFEIKVYVDENRIVTFGADGKDTVTFIKENITTKFNNHKEAYDYIHQKKQIDTVNYKLRPKIIPSNIPMPHEFTASQIQKQFNDYKAVLATCSSKAEIFDKSMSYWSKIMPEKSWATSKDQLLDPNFTHSKYLDKVTANINLYDEESFQTLLCLRSSITTYNGLHASNMDDLSIIKHRHIGVNTFYATIDRMLQS